MNKGPWIRAAIPAAIGLALLTVMVVAIPVASTDRAPIPPDPSPPLPPPPDLLPAEVVSDLQSLLARHPYYLRSIPESDQRRLTGLLAAGTAGPSDLAWTRTVLASRLPPIMAEEDALSRRLSELEEHVRRWPPDDALLLASGERFEGVLVYEGEDEIQLEATVNGIRGRRSFPRAEVVEIIRGRATREFLDRYEGLEVDPESLTELLAWTAARGLDAPRRIVALRLLMLEPDHAGARTAAGYVRADDGSWKLPNE